MKQKTEMTEKSAWAIFSKYIRLRDAIKTTGTKLFCRCCTCGKIKHITEIQAGHFLSRRYKAIMFDERNNHVQCVACNTGYKSGRGGNPEMYRVYMLKTYGKKVIDELEYRKKGFVQRKSEDFKLIADKYRMKIKELEVI